MFKGMQLMLFLGQVYGPLPAGRAVVDALESLEVKSSTERSGFQLTFGVGKDSKLLNELLPMGQVDPILTRAIIVVIVRGISTVLMDGVVTNQELSPSNDPGGSKLTLTGEDLTVLMDLVEMPFMRYPGMPEVAQMYAILAKYAGLGIVPVVMPPVIESIPNPVDEIPTHTGTDYAYIKLHADYNGYVFYLEPGPAPGMSIAYCGPDVRDPMPQPALNVNMDAHTNVESLSFSHDGMKKEILVLNVYDPGTEKVPIPVPVPNVSVLRPPLGLRPSPPFRVKFMDETTKLKPEEAAKRALGIRFAAADAITASGSLDVLRYGRVLQARKVVGVRGAGIAYDGMYYVNSVTHNIKRGEYKQSFSLSRDGMVSQTGAVMP